MTAAAPNTAVFNGVDMATGGYLFPPEPLADLAARAREDRLEDEQVGLLRDRHLGTEDHLGLMFGISDPDDLAQAGWGLVLPPEVAPGVLEALEPLRTLRRAQAGERYREFTLRPDESAGDFLYRHGMGPDPVDPRRVPYYLLLVGSATEIPFEVQYDLDVLYAVGRLDLEDLDDLASYATAVVAAETGPDTARAVHLFGTRNPDDVATALSASRLVEPLADEIAALAPAVAVGRDVGTGATRARLDEVMTDVGGAPVLFTATHGLGGTTGHDDAELRGALVCQEWRGPGGRPAPVPRETCLAGQDLALDRALGPRVVFAFACYSAGWPAATNGPAATASLPRRMLANRRRPVLAFIGHVDRAWGYSFLWVGADPQISAPASTVLSLATGRRVGAAMEYLNQRSAAIASELVSRLELLRRFGKRIDDQELAWLWTASNDARHHIVLGDPAVRAISPEASR